jgi:hypothetical protein
MSINRVDRQSRFNYTGTDKSSGNVIKGKNKNSKASKKNNQPVSENDPDYSDNAQIKARNKKLEGVVHYDDGVQKEAKLRARKESLEGLHYDDHIQKEVKSKVRRDELEGTVHYHDNLQTESNKTAKRERKKGDVEGRKDKTEKEEWDQFSRDTDRKPKKEKYFEFAQTKQKQTDKSQKSGAASQVATASEAAKAGSSKKVLTVDAHLKIAEGGAGYLHATFSDPSIEELYHTTRISDADVKSLDATMKKFFLAPLKRDMTLRVMTLYLNSLAKEFLAQLDYEIVQTKLKVSSIMSQKDELMEQAVAKLAGGISESLVTAGAAGLSIGASSSGLRGLSKETGETKDMLKEANKTIDTMDKGLATNKSKLKGLERQRSDLDAKNTPRDSDEYKKLEKEIDITSKGIDDQEALKTTAVRERGDAEEKQRQILRKVDLKVARLNGYSQLVSAGKGFINGITDYYVTINQANIKIQDAVQAQLQLTKDNARMFMQKSNEYITSLLSSLLSIINSVYQARRGIITS